MARSKILDYEFYRSLQSMDKDELYDTMKNLVKAGNNSLRKLEKSGASEFSESYQDVMETGKFKNTKDMTRNQMLHEAKRLKEYMESDDNTTKKVSDKAEEFKEIYSEYTSREETYKEWKERQTREDFYDEYPYYEDEYSWWGESQIDKDNAVYKAMNRAKELIEMNGDFVDGSPIEIKEVLSIAIDNIVSMDDLVSYAYKYYKSNEAERESMVSDIMSGVPFTAEYEDFSFKRR